MKIKKLFTLLLFLSSVKYVNSQHAWSAYLFPDDIIKKYPDCIDTNNRSDCDRVSWEYSFIGEIFSCLKAWNISQSEHQRKIPEQYENLELLKAESAKEYILNNIKDQRVLMINEAHHLPYHRVFCADLLKSLYDKGFRYLGVETLSEDEINTRGFPVINSGPYLQESQYGNLVRYAISLGFTVFRYEGDGGGQEREIGQANNIYDIIKRVPEAKIIVHAGWGHIREDTIYGKLMAWHFKEISGIDPFTISQATLNEQSSTEFEADLYKKIVPEKHPVLFLKKTTNKPVNYGVTDLTIFHPRTKMIKSRPSYLYNNNRYKKVKIKNNHKFKEPHFVFAFLKSELDTGKLPTPVDIIYFSNPDYSSFILLLPFKGKYTLVYKSKTEIKFSETEVN